MDNLTKTSRNNTLLKRSVLLFILSSQILYCQVLSAEQKIYSVLIENRMTPAGKSQYNRLLTRLQELGLSFKLTFTSPPRRTRTLSKNTNSCTFPASAALLNDLSDKMAKHDFISGDPVDYIGMVLTVRNDSSYIKNRADLAGKRIGIISTFDENKILKGIEYGAVMKSNNHDELLLLLLNKRVDLILAFMPHILISAKKLNVLPPHSTDIWFSPKYAISIVCHDSEKNRVFIKAFNQHLKTLKSSGELRRIFGPYVELRDGAKEYF